MLAFAGKQNKAMTGPGGDGSMSARSGRSSGQISYRSSNLGGMSARGNDNF